jgi:hypothetical protein
MFREVDFTSDFSDKLCIIQLCVRDKMQCSCFPGVENFCFVFHSYNYLIALRRHLNVTEIFKISIGKYVNEIRLSYIFVIVHNLDYT